MAPPNFLANAGFLKLYWSINGQLAMNVYGVRIPPTVSGITQATADTLGVAVKAGFTAHLAGLMNGGNALAKVGIRDWRQPNLPEFRDAGAQVAGTEPGNEPMPAGVALVVTLRTAAAGKRFTGRTYIPGFSETQNVLGAAAPTASTGAVNFVDSIGAALEASGMFLAVISRPSERVLITKTTTQADGTEVVEVISDQEARVGSVTDVNRLEARTAAWEYQRRRDNTRGGSLPAILSSVASKNL